MRILAFVLSGLILVGCGGPRYAVVPPEEHGHKQVVKVPGIKKQVLFDRASEWVALKYVSGQDVIQDKNANTGRIIGRGATTIVPDSGGLMDVYERYTYSLVLDVKDGKARIQLGDYQHATYGNTPSMALYVRPLNASMAEVAADFELYLKTGGAGAIAGAKDDW